MVRVGGHSCTPLSLVTLVVAKGPQAVKPSFFTKESILMEGRINSIGAHFQDLWEQGKSLRTLRMIAYWTCTFFIAFEMMAGGIWDLLRIEYVRVVLARLGYPM